jgi:hypothetical protein
VAEASTMSITIPGEWKPYFGDGQVWHLMGVTEHFSSN